MTEEEEKVLIPKRIVVAFTVMIVLFFLILVGFAIVIVNIQDLSHESNKLVKENDNRITEIRKLSKEANRLSKQNKALILEIQASRISSCRQTYNAFPQIFRPFFPLPPRTREQQANLDKFNQTVDKYRHRCTKQTKPKEPK